MRLLLFAAMLAVALAGCTDGPDESRDWRVSGHFTAEPRPDWDEWNALVATYTDAPAMIMESFPEQFAVEGLTEAGCAAFRAEVLALPYVASAGDCRT